MYRIFRLTDTGNLVNVSKKPLSFYMKAEKELKKLRKEYRNSEFVVLLVC